MEFEGLRAFTCARRNLNDHTLDENLPQLPHQRLRLPPRDHAGMFDALPLELLHQTLVQLDLRSLMNFRYVNRRAAELVESEPQYKAIAKFAQNALRGILSVQTGTWTTCAMLFNKLVTPECEECGDFAGYLYLITCKRVCFLCLSDRAGYLPLGEHLARRRYGLDHQETQKLPHMKTVPGIYSPAKCTPAKCRAI